MLLSLALSICKYEAFPRLLFGICLRTFCLGKYSLACVNIYYESIVYATDQRGSICVCLLKYERSIYFRGAGYVGISLPLYIDTAA